MAEVFKQCPDCLAHYTGHHECFGLMKMLVTAHKEKKKRKTVDASIAITRLTFLHGQHVIEKSASKSVVSKDGRNF